MGSDRDGQLVLFIKPRQSPFERKIIKKRRKKMKRLTTLYQQKCNQSKYYNELHNQMTYKICGCCYNSQHMEIVGWFNVLNMLNVGFVECSPQTTENIRLPRLNMWHQLWLTIARVHAKSKCNCFLVVAMICIKHIHIHTPSDDHSCLYKSYNTSAQI